jgi:hypothetical protein
MTLLENKPKNSVIIGEELFRDFSFVELPRAGKILLGPE